MCRVLSYLGKPIVMNELLNEPDNSFIKQSYNPRYMSQLLNLAGFGMAAWETNSHEASAPFLYRIPTLPFYDENLRSLTKKINPSCLLAHLRGVSYTEKQIVSAQNVHPFMFQGTSVALAHNGALQEFDKMKYALLEFIKPEFQKDIRGNTDSEWIYAIFISQLTHMYGDYEPAEIIHAINDTLKILQRVRHKHDIHSNSPVNLFITNGKFIAATRFVFDYGWPSAHDHTLAHAAYHSLWYTYGDSYGLYDKQYQMKGNNKKSSIIISSEPLTEDSTTWIEVPEYTLLVANHIKDEIQIISQDINL